MVRPYLRLGLIMVLLDRVFMICCPLCSANERPSAVTDDNIILVLHGLNPLRILESLDDSARFRDRWKKGDEVISRVGFDDGTFRSSLHGMMV